LTGIQVNDGGTFVSSEVGAWRDYGIDGSAGDYVIDLRAGKNVTNIEFNLTQDININVLTEGDDSADAFIINMKSNGFIFNFQFTPKWSHNLYPGESTGSINGVSYDTFGFYKVGSTASSDWFGVKIAENVPG